MDGFHKFFYFKMVKSYIAMILLLLSIKAAAFVKGVIPVHSEKHPDPTSVTFTMQAKYKKKFLGGVGHGTKTGY